MRRAALAVALGALGTLAPTAARAQPTTRDTGYVDDPTENALLAIDDCPPAPALPADKLQERAKQQYLRGWQLYSQGDYPAAVTELVDAFCLQPQAYTILKDIGQAYERDLDYERALAYFKRYVRAVPPGAKAADQCAPDPAEDKENVLARIRVLAKMRAQVLVQTDPKDAEITIASAAGVRAVGKSGQKMEVFRGRYTLTVAKRGFETVTQSLETEIGKPLSVFVHLDPVRGELVLRATPNDARLYLDNNYVGTGGYEDHHIATGTYTLSAEAPGHERATQEIVVLPDQEAHVQLELEALPQTGRRQAIIASTIAGAATIGSITNAFDKLGVSGVAGGSIVGAALGLGGAFFFLPENIRLGTSSLAITSTMAGYLVGTTGTAIFSSDDNVITPLAGLGAMVGAAVGYYVGDATVISSGDAAVVNTGVVWGSAIGFLFSESFAATRRIGSALTLSGLAMGGVGGALSAHYFHVSRSHAALIDLGGVLGLVGGLAAEALAYPTKSGNATASAKEHISNFAIGGLALGLVTTGILTRNYDTPAIPVAPTFGAAQNAHGGSTATFGITGSF